MVQKLINDEGWQNTLKLEFAKDYFKKLLKNIEKERKNYIIYPTKNLQFNAFNKTPFEKVKVVILGQDPYHNPGQAHGLCFSVPEGIAIPRSLKNIFKELQSDLNFAIHTSGNLEKWASQGVLLLNTVLTVRENNPKSHQNLGWEIFTDAVIKNLSDNKNHLVFILWGNDAQTKQNLIDNNKHMVLMAAHPSPFSASRGFFGCKHFSKTNNYLIKNRIEPICWEL